MFRKPIQLSLAVCLLCLLAVASSSGQNQSPPQAASNRVTAQASLDAVAETLASDEFQEQLDHAEADERRLLLKGVYDELSQAVATDPTFAGAYAARFEFVWRYNRVRVTEDLQMAVNLAPREWSYRTQLMSILEFQGKRSEARKVAQAGYDLLQAELTGSAEPNSNEDLIKFAFMAERFEETVALCSAYIEATSQAEALRRIRGLSLVALGKIGEAEADRANALACAVHIVKYRELRPELMPQGLVQLARDAVIFIAKRIEDTVAQCNVYLEATDEAKAIRRIRGLSLVALGKIAQAEPDLAAAMVHPVHVFDYRELNSELEARELVQLARDAVTFRTTEQRAAMIDQAIEKDSSLAVAYYERAVVRLKIHDFEQLRLRRQRDNRGTRRRRPETQPMPTVPQRPTFRTPKKTLRSTTPRVPQQERPQAAQLTRPPTQLEQAQRALAIPGNILADLAQAKTRGFKDPKRDELEATVRKRFPRAENTVVPWAAAFRSTKRSAGILLFDYRNPSNPQYQKPEVLLKAIEKWNQLAKGYPRVVPIHLERLRVLTKWSPGLTSSGQRQETEKLLRLLDETHQQVRGEVLSLRLGFLIDRGDWVAALDEVDQYGDQIQSESAALGVLLYHKGQYAQALRAFPAGPPVDVLERMIIEPENATEWAQWAGAWAIAGNHEKAIMGYTEALQLEPTSMLALCWRAGQHIALGDYAAAEVDINSALKLHPTSSEAYATRGALRQAQLRLDDALADHAKALEYSARRVECHARRAMIFYFHGDLAQAKKEITALAVMQPPDHPLILPMRLLAPPTKGTRIPAPAAAALSDDPATRQAETEALVRLVRGDVLGLPLDGIALLTRDLDQELFPGPDWCEPPMPDVGYRGPDSYFQAAAGLPNWRHKELGKYLSTLFPRFRRQVLWWESTSPFAHQPRRPYRDGRGDILLKQFGDKLHWLEDLHATGLGLKREVTEKDFLRGRYAEASDRLLSLAETAPTNIYADPLLPADPDTNPALAALLHSKLHTKRGWDFGWRPWHDDGGRVSYYLDEASRLLTKKRLTEAIETLESIRPDIVAKRVRLPARVTFHSLCATAYERQGELLKALRAIDQIIPPDWGYSGMLDLQLRYATNANVDYKAEYEKVRNMSPGPGTRLNFLQRAEFARKVRKQLDGLQESERNFKAEMGRQLAVRRGYLSRRIDLQLDVGDVLGAIADLDELIEARDADDEPLFGASQHALWRARRGALTVASGDDTGYADMLSVFAVFKENEARKHAGWARSNYAKMNVDDPHGKRAARLLGTAQLKLDDQDIRAGTDDFYAALPHMTDDPQLRTQLSKLQAHFVESTHQDAIKLKDEQKYPEAISVYKRAINAAPYHADLHADLCWCYMQLKHSKYLTAAIVEADRMVASLKIEAEPSKARRARGFEYRGLALLRYGSYIRAIKDLQESLALEPTGLRQMYLGRCHWALMEDAKAEEAFARAVKMSPDLTNEISTIKAAPRFDLFEFTTREEMEMDTTTYSATGEFRLQEKDYAGAVADLGEVVRRDPTWSKTWVSLARAHIQLSDFVAAAELLRRSVETKKDDPYTRRMLGQCLVETKQYKEAIRQLDHTITLEKSYRFKDLAQAHLLRGRAHLELGDRTKAKADVSKAESIQRKHLANSNAIKKELATLVTRLDFAESVSELVQVEPGTAGVRKLIASRGMPNKLLAARVRDKLDAASDRDLAFVLTGELVFHAKAAEEPAVQEDLARRAAALGDVEAASLVADQLFKRGELDAALPWYAAVANHPSDFQRHDIGQLRSLARGRIWLIGELSPRVVTSSGNLEPKQLPPLNTHPLASTGWQFYAPDDKKKLEIILLPNFQVYEVGQPGGGLQNAIQMWTPVGDDGIEIQLTRHSRSMAGVFEGRLADANTMHLKAGSNITLVGERIPSTHLAFALPADRAKVAGSTWLVTHADGSSDQFTLNKDRTILYKFLSGREHSSWESDDAKIVRMKLDKGTKSYWGRLVAPNNIEGTVEVFPKRRSKYSAKRLATPAVVPKSAFLDGAKLSGSSWKMTSSLKRGSQLYRFNEDHTITTDSVSDDRSHWESLADKSVRLSLDGGDAIYLGRFTDADTIEGEANNRRKRWWWTLRRIKPE